jgi:CRP/FNR family cyclic AMP-dependent transcriptional regulator
MPLVSRRRRPQARPPEGESVGTTKGTVSALAKVPLFADCSRRELQTISRVVRDIPHAAGTVIAREGDPGVGLFVILSGNAEVSIGGRRKATLGPGDFFGEIALLDGGPRTATVTAKTDVQLLGLTEWVFRGLMAEHPSIALKTLQQMATRLRVATKAVTG